MFGYLLSVAIAFIVFGTVFNIIKKINPTWYDNDYNDEGWFIVIAASFLWGLAVPTIIVMVVLYLLKLLTDKITNVIMSQLKKRNETKGV
jgi:hypothetical protein